MSDLVISPRVLIVATEQWPRALLRAHLREVGYDAIGAPSLAHALGYARREPGSGPVRLLMIDQDVVEQEGADLLALLRRVHDDPATVLLAHVTRELPQGEWTSVLRRPVSIGQIVETVQGLLPLPPSAAVPLDE